VSDGARSSRGLLQELVETESPTYSDGVRLVAERMAQELTRLGGETTLLEGSHLVSDIPGTGKPVLLLGHTDTVWPLGTLETMPFRVEGDIAYGPGAYDMKGGLVVLLEALRRAQRRRAIRVFLTADEEMGSRTGRPHLEAAAEGTAAAFVVEPPGADGGLKTARKGLGRFRVLIHGRSAHAGTNRTEGASAIEELAHQVLALHALNDDERGISVNVGVVSGGTTENVVAAEAEAQVDVRVRTWADRAFMEERLAALEPHVPGVQLELGGGWTRPPLERSAGTAALFAKAREHARAVGLDLKEGASGGGSDGNLVGAVGVPVLDGLGIEGGGAHARDEHALLSSVPVRAELLARILRDPGL
jgi:glutamate carboxypeptidase